MDTYDFFPDRKKIHQIPILMRILLLYNIIIGNIPIATIIIFKLLDDYVNSHILKKNPAEYVIDIIAANVYHKSFFRGKTLFSHIPTTLLMHIINFILYTVPIYFDVYFSRKLNLLLSYVIFFILIM